MVQEIQSAELRDARFTTERGATGAALGREAPKPVLSCALKHMAATASSAVLRIWYEPNDESLFVTFAGGKTYVYEGVPGQLCRSFLAAESRGKFFNVHIRDRYPHRLVKTRRTS